MADLLTGIITLGFLALILLGVSGVVDYIHEWVSSFDDDAAQEIEDGLLYGEQHAHQAEPRFWAKYESPDVVRWGENQHDDVPLCGETEVGE